jgi:hypothetical protein
MRIAWRLLSHCMAMIIYCWHALKLEGVIEPSPSHALIKSVTIWQNESSEIEPSNRMRQLRYHIINPLVHAPLWRCINSVSSWHSLENNGMKVIREGVGSVLQLSCLFVAPILKFLLQNSLNFNIRICGRNISLFYTCFFIFPYAILHSFPSRWHARVPVSSLHSEAVFLYVWISKL